MPEHRQVTDAEVKRLIGAYVGVLGRQAPPSDVASAVTNRVQSRHTRATVGRLIGAGVTVLAIALVIGIAGAVHLGILAGPSADNWQVMSVPSGFNATGISCVSSGQCWAVGPTGIWEYYQGSWSVDNSPTKGTLDAVSCVTSSDCWAVGSHYTVPQGLNDGVIQPLIEHGDGGVFTMVSAPAVSGDIDHLTSITCTTADDCWATGNFGANSENGGDGVSHPLMEHYDGVSWTVMSSSSAPMLDGLAVVGCLSVDDCWGLGGTSNGSTVEHYDGESWAIVSGSQLPTGVGSVGLGGLTCIGSGDCWAVGSVFNSQEALPEEPVIAHLSSSGTWTDVPGPSIGASEGGGLLGIACLSASNCWAVGGIQGSLEDLITGTPPPYTAVPIIEHYSDGSWELLSGTEAGGGTGLLDAVACIPSTGACYAVGDGFAESTRNS
jgi:hypothetical protein